ncbi:MAG: SDR family oxidoreductase [Pirellulales bacterium]|nr:SDR family oxidoreductase [Pirellulales bacterium]
MRLKDKVAIVTGTSSGIGLGIAEVFAEEGAKVVCVARREKEGEAVAESIRGKGGSAVFVTCDVSVEEQVEELARRTIDDFGRIDVLVNNAGVNFVKAFEEVTAEDWDRVIGVDLRGTFLCTKACIGQFLKQGSGSVVNIATVHTMACMAGAAPYDAAKWGMVGLTKSLAVEYAARDIRFNCLSPGLIDTQIWDDIRNGAEDMDTCLAHWWSNIPMGRVGTIREIAQAAVFLASDEAAYITGANLLADGGMTSQLISTPSYASKAQQRK